MMPFLFRKLNAFPSTPEPNALYLIKKGTDLVDIVFTGANASVINSVLGFPENIAETLLLSVMSSTIQATSGEITNLDSIGSAIGKMFSLVNGFQASIQGQAILSSQTYVSVPVSFVAPYVVVTEPHYRFMVWDGDKYVRAPWHRPGVLFHSDLDPVLIDYAIQVRNDVVYNSSSHPDLAEALGVTDSTFILPDGRGRVLRGADLGSGIDTNLVNGSLTESAMRKFTGSFIALVPGRHGDFRKDPFIATSGNVEGFPTSATFPASYQSPGAVDSNKDGFLFDNSLVTPTADEFRVKSLTSTIYITR